MSSRAPKLGNNSKNVFSGGAISSKKPCHVPHGSTTHLPWYLDRKSAESGPESPREGGSPGLGRQGSEHPRWDQTGRPTQEPGQQLELVTWLNRKGGRNGAPPKRDSTVAFPAYLTRSARRRKGPRPSPWYQESALGLIRDPSSFSQTPTLGPQWEWNRGAASSQMESNGVKIT